LPKSLSCLFREIELGETANDVAFLVARTMKPRIGFEETDSGFNRVRLTAPEHMVKRRQHILVPLRSFDILPIRINGVPPFELIPSTLFLALALLFPPLCRCALGRRAFGFFASDT
jgi:hypothetical protein